MAGNIIPIYTPAFLGIDVGTSGIRAIIIDGNNKVLASSMHNMPAPTQPQPHYSEQVPHVWWQTLQTVLTDLSKQFDFKHIVTVALDATSGTVLLIDQQGEPLTTALMYNDQRAIDYVSKIEQYAPENSPTCSATSGLAKAMWLLDKRPESRPDTFTETAYIAHQADWLAGKLTHQFQHTDNNNALKSGYDSINKQWPEWLEQLGIQKTQLPQVTPAGTLVCPLDELIIQQFGFNPEVCLVSGTTDSTAALLATGANNVGDAVTSLGSSLVLKIISDKPVFSSEAGIYSQPLGKHWLVGGASNSGGAVLRHYFSDQQMSQLETQLQPSQATGLHYYPLLQTGERFPINNPYQPPCVTPRPDNDAIFFQALLEGITAIEQQGYQKLQQLGAPVAQRLFSVGGGTINKAWTTLRQQILNIPMHSVLNNHAAFGAALLAKQGYDSQNKTTE